MYHYIYFKIGNQSIVKNYPFQYFVTLQDVYNARITRYWKEKNSSEIQHESMLRATVPFK